MRIGILGGGFFWGAWGKQYSTIYPDTPYGKPSDRICFGQYGKHEVFTLQRHGIRHEFDPTSIPWLANVYAMYMQELDFIIHVAVCGSLSNLHQPGEIVLFDQILDFTKKRPLTFGPPVINSVTHLNVSEPVSSCLRNAAQEIFLKNNISHHFHGTIITEEGPRFSTNAEIKMFRMWGGDLINHTSSTEVLLCNEIGLPVLAVVLVTNRIEINKSEDLDKYEDIADNIFKYKTIIPHVIESFLENVEEIEIQHRPMVKAFEVEKLDLRTN